MMKLTDTTASAASVPSFTARQRMERLLRRERARSDRSDNPFALVVFSRPRNARNSDLLTPVATAVEARVRETDEFGWLDDRSVHAMLFDTDAQGGRSFADEICGIVESGSPRPTFTIYSYPPRRGEEHGDIRADGIERIEEHDEDSGENLAILESTLLAGLAIEMHEPGEGVQCTEEPFIHPMPRWKRWMDAVCSAAALIVLSPLFAMVALAVRWTSPGPVIFGQKRSGLGCVPFTLYKFRTMVVDAEEKKHELMDMNEQDGPAFKIKNDPRVTPLGRILRKTSIDELPQLWNVLKGDMTLVGPRPLPCNETEASDQWHRRRLDVTPGLTCIWQVESRSSVTFDEWVRMDVRYIRRRTFWHDLKLIFRTIPALLWKRSGH